MPQLQLKILATKWGFTNSLDEFCRQVKTSGYDGVEIFWPKTKQEQEEIFRCLEAYDLEMGIHCGVWQKSTGDYARDFENHMAEFRGTLHQLAKLSYKPLYINCHIGKDYFSFAQNKALIDYSIEVSRKEKIKICHETHRARTLFSPFVTKQFLDKIPELRLTFDVSHWCVVSESLLEDQAKAVNLAIERTDHIHARVGHREGPQVSDPRAPEWQEAVDAHFAWWDAIVDLKKSRGEALTILTEFGAPPYMPTLAYTQQPVADQWELNLYMLKTLRERYQG